ncbi:MAG: CARDB domain-containing protein [Thermoplasmata archaeon]
MSSRSGFVSSVLIASSLIVLVMYSPSMRSPGPWNTETVVSAGNVGKFPSMLFDSSNTPHIAYADYTNHALKHASWNGASWDVEDVESGINPGYVSLVLGSDDTLHVGYFDALTETVRYAHGNGASWSVEIVDYTTGNLMEYVSMDLDSNDVPHFAYIDVPVFDNYSLIYTNKTGGSWESQLVRWTNGSGTEAPDVTIALDSYDRPRIVWSGYGNMIGMHFLEWNGTSWSDEVIDDDLYDMLPWGCYPDMGLDSNDVPYVAFCELTSPYDGAWDARVAYKVEDSWIFETFDIGIFNPNGWVGQFFSVAFDSFDRPHITYTDYGGGAADTFDLFYAFRSDFGWIVETADPGKVTHSSVAIDHCDMPHVAYVEISAGASDADLRHAWKDCTTPYPDLTLSPSDISFSPSGPVLNGTSVTIEAMIHNSGVAVAADVTVRVHDGTPSPANQINGDKVIPVLIAGSSDTIQAQWNASPPGEHNVCVSIDPEGNITEINELNNEACATIQVDSPQPPAPPNMLEAHLTGVDSEHVTMTWSLSSDDLGGLRNVVRYDILRGEQYSSDIFGYVLLGSVSSGTSTYVDEYAGEGDPDNHFYVACAVNALGNLSCSDNQAGKFTRPLSQGPNLVSIPLVQSDESIETVLQTVEYDKAWTYDSSSREWNWHMTFKEYRRGLWNANHSIGLWVNVAYNSNLTVAGVVPAQTTIHLHEGWNLVSFPSFNASFSVSDLKVEIGATRVEGYDPLPPYFLKAIGDAEMLQAGYGYWVRAEVDTDWIVEVS